MADSDRWLRIERLYRAALERPPEQQAAFLGEACPDASLRRAIESLLAYSGARENLEPRTAGLLADSPSPTVTLESPADAAGIPAVPFRPRIGELVGTYRILSGLGKGGMGEVYLAFDVALERKVAVKLLPLEFTADTNRVRRFAQEAKAASALNHPNIVSIYTFGESEFGHYIAMELIDGRNLRALTPLPLAPGLIREIGAQVAKALEVTHAAGLIHRDIKPDNIMVRKDGLVKVLDFGLARLAGPVADLLDSGTLPGTVVGTVMYMSPEQARGEFVAAASDIFFLGIVFYELATGQHPFPADSSIGFLHSIVSRQVIPPSRLNPGIPAWLEGLLLRMLEKVPDKRCAVGEVVAAFREQEAWTPSAGGPAAPSRRTVGRRKERAELHSTFQSVIDGHSSILFVSGEPGQGKTTLVEDFLMDLASENKALVARGRCSEHLAGAGAYLPVLEFLDSLVNGAERELVTTMKTLAPTWYAQLAPGSEPLREEGALSQERLKRELAALLQEISRQQPLAIFLDDVHWADISTVDLLSYLSTRLDRIRLLLVASFRPAELHAGNPQFVSLQLDLQARGIAREMALSFFATEEIQEYIDLKFPDNAFPDEFARMIHERTEGNPLFVVDLLRYLQERQAIVLRDGQWVLTGSLAETITGLPESVRSMVQRKMEQLGEDERKLLMAASIQGTDFDAAVVAETLDADAADIEEALEKLERKSGFVKLAAEHEYPNRSLTLRYRFVHALYQNAFYAALRPTRRVSLSKLAAEALLHFHGPQAGKIAAQLGFLFETARDFERAARQFQLASQNALRLFASREAEALARRGLDAVRSAPDAANRTRLELGLQSALAAAIRDRKTHASGETLETHQRVHALSQEAGDRRSAFFAQVGLFWSALVRSDRRGAREQAGQCRATAEQIGDPGLVMQADYLLGYLTFHSGEHEECERVLRTVLALYDPSKHIKMIETFSLDVRANGMALLGLNLWYLGFPDQARAKSQEAIDIARTLPYPIPLTLTLMMKTFLSDFLDDPRAMDEASGEVIAIAEKHGLQTNTLFWGKFGHGWALARMGRLEEGKAQMREAIADAQTMGMIYVVPVLDLALAFVLAGEGAAGEALALIGKHLPHSEKAGTHEKLPEMYRLKGELLLRQGLELEAEKFLLLALETARQTGARSLELRAATSLSRLYHARGEPAVARKLLAEIYGWFTEGFDTPDLRNAKALLEQIAHGAANDSSL